MSQASLSRGGLSVPFKHPSMNALQGSASPKKPYLETLPQSHDCTLSWNDSEMEALKGVQSKASSNDCCKCTALAIRRIKIAQADEAHFPSSISLLLYVAPSQMCSEG